MNCIIKSRFISLQLSAMSYFKCAACFWTEASCEIKKIWSTLSITLIKSMSLYSNNIIHVGSYCKDVVNILNVISLVVGWI